MISEDMLKKLLDEFVEKEILIQEELKVIEEQIVELENRLATCNERLGTISGDRDKVVAMRSRYLEGNFTFDPSQYPAAQAANDPANADHATAAATAHNGISAILHSRLSAQAPNVVASPPAPPQDSNTERDNVWSDSASQPAGGSFLYPDPVAAPVRHAPEVDEDTAVAGSVEPSAPAVQPGNTVSPGASPMVDLGADDGNEEADNDTVKSINDALRSLFR